MKLVIALGGNALQGKGEKGTDIEQLKHIENTCAYFLELIQEKYHFAISHGNGPQVGNILLQNEIAVSQVPAMPLDICGAQSQGMIGYMIQRTLHNQLVKKNVEKPIVTLLTQVLVSSQDPAFQNPTKPIGPFYSEKEAHIKEKEKGWKLIEQIGKGYRRVVPSPKPIDIIEKEMIKNLFDQNDLLITCGGGGIPVIKKDQMLVGVEGVIDKDLTSALLAQILKVDVLLILTDIEKVAINFGKPDQKNLDHLTLDQARMYHEEGEFAKGSMGPKIQAAIQFVQNGGKKAIITSLNKAKDALSGKTGTSITAN